MNTLTPFIEHKMRNLPNDTHNVPPAHTPDTPPNQTHDTPPDEIPHPQPANVPQCKGGYSTTPLGTPPLQSAGCGINGLPADWARADPDRRENKTARMENVSGGAHGRGCLDEADRLGVDEADTHTADRGSAVSSILRADEAQTRAGGGGEASACARHGKAHGGTHALNTDAASPADTVTENGGSSYDLKAHADPDKNFGYGSKQVPAGQHAKTDSAETLRAGTPAPSCRCAPMRQKNAQDFLEGNTPGIMAFYAPEHRIADVEAELRPVGHPADPSSRNTAAEDEETVLRLLEWREESPNS